MNERVNGICKICKKEKELSFEHIPPRSAFNSETKYYYVSIEDYYKKAKEYVFNGVKPKSKKEQGGLGDYFLCKECNGFLGSKYVRDYKKFAQIAMHVILANDKFVKSYEFNIPDINLLAFLKQIVSIFVCSNHYSFTEDYPELLEFIKNEAIESLPKRYRFYMYLNIEGQLRNGNIHFTNVYGTVCEFTFKPFGFVLSIDNDNQIKELCEITAFQQFNSINRPQNISIVLNKYPTYYPIPLDFRTKDELNII